jgi:RNA polymerase sigma factor (sigma-70 family)
LLTVGFYWIFMAKALLKLKDEVCFEIENESPIRSKSKRLHKTEKIKNNVFLSQSEIQALVLEHVEHGKRLAWSFLSGWRIFLPRDEVESAVGAALCEAANRFDPSRKVDFKTFLFYHLRGMLLKEVSKTIEQQKLVQLSSFSADGSESSYEKTPVGIMVDYQNPESVMEQRELSARCWEACSQLDELEREVLVRCFVNDQSLIDIAEELNYCRCHISRVKSRALGKLSSVLGEMARDEQRVSSSNVRVLRQYSGGRGRRGESIKRKHA